MSEVNKQEKIRKVFLDDLPRWEKGDGAVKVGTINWKKSIGYKIKGVYDNVNFVIEIIDYKDRYLYIKYLDKPIFKIHTASFCECKLGKLLSKYTSNFKVYIGQILKNDKRDIIIIQREHRVKIKNNGSKQKCKYYKYKCNKCGNEDWMLEGDLLKEKGCNTCCPNPQKIVLGINTIYDTNRWMIDLGISEEDAKRYTSQSNKKITVKCPYCRREKIVTISNIYKCHSIGCICGDGFSKPEKFMSSVLEQLNLDFKTQLSKTTFKWCDKYKYDFYFEYNGEGYVIEVNGLQHYKEKFKNSRPLKSEQENDKIKKELALRNSIKEENYIVINCSKSELEYIKQNILISELNSLFDLSKIDWNKAEEFALSNKVKEACNLWNSGVESTREIGEIMRLDMSTIRIYLKQGTKLGWCDYNGKYEMKKNGIKNSKYIGKRIEIFKDNKSFGIFPSCKELSKKSEELFGVKLIGSSISAVANGSRNHHKGYTFQYL